MKQQWQSVEGLASVLQQRGGTVANEEEWVIKRSEFYALAGAFGRKLAEVDEKLVLSVEENRQCKLQVCAQAQQLSNLREELQTTGQELERLRLLLPIKEQLISECRRQVDALKEKIRVDALNRTFSRVIVRESLEQMSPIQCQSRGEQTGDTKRKICLKKEKSKTNHAFQLEIARLRNQVTKLRAQNDSISAQMTLLKIENEFIENQCKLAFEQERRVAGKMKKILENPKQVSLSQKCQQLQNCFERLTERVQKAEKGEANGRKSEALHPPTPHFSGTVTGFGRRDKHLSAPAGVFPLEEELSLGQL